MSIVEFLLARIAEDEAVARDASESDPSKQGHYMDEGPAGNKWTTADGMVSGQSGDLWDCEGSDTLCTSPEVAEHFARHDPARVLAECEAKRVIVEAATSWEHEFNPSAYYACRAYKLKEDTWKVLKISEGKCNCGVTQQRNAILKPLAAIYADHKDYDPGWAL
jgi:hypothetical protein